MNSILHKADSRGHADYGWLNSYHSFSFANYHNSERINFGALRVLNDDHVAEGRGFSMHRHENMEIISIPLEGDLEHKDSLGNVSVIKQGDIQVLSAGTGIFHSEYNKNDDRAVKFLQIWVIPNKRQVKPRYDQISLEALENKNGFNQILSPYPDEQGVWIHQDAWFHMANFQAGQLEKYRLKRHGNGVYAFVLNGTVEIDGQQLETRDGLGIWDTESIDLNAIGDTKVLLMEVPMKI
jgi:redox-sensitive bicupin YhaK (pirin superfamily)